MSEMTMGDVLAAMLGLQEVNRSQGQIGRAHV